MATSSITENLRVNNPKLLEVYAEALERTETEPVQQPKERTFVDVTDPGAIRDILKRNIENWGKKN